MAVSPYKTFSAGEVLTASDLNNSFTQITANGEDLGWPATKAKDLDGQSLILDSDGDSSITADTDDRVDFNLGGFDAVRFNTVASAVNGFDLTSSATGNDIIIAAYGSDTNIDIALNPKGSGNVRLGKPLAIVDGGTGSNAASGARTNLGLVIGTDVQAWDTQLDDIAALAVTDSNFIVGNGTNWVAESGATVRTSLGLGTLATLNSVTATEIDTDAVGQSEIAANAVGKSETKTTSGDVTTTSTTYTLMALPGGDEGFFPRYFIDAGSYEVRMAEAFTNTSESARVAAKVDNVANTLTIRQTYFQASPPYDMGDGEIPLFIFAMIDNSTSNILATYVAPEAPWHYNGPTNLITATIVDGKQYRKVLDIPAGINSLRERSDFFIDDFVRNQYLQAIKTASYRLEEITQQMKQADMNLIPHPFLGNDLTNKTIVMLDPVSSIVDDWRYLKNEGENIGELIRKYVTIDNQALTRSTPDGTIVVAASWKNTP